MIDIKNAKCGAGEMAALSGPLPVQDLEFGSQHPHQVTHPPVNYSSRGSVPSPPQAPTHAHTRTHIYNSFI